MQDSQEIHCFDGERCDLGSCVPVTCDWEGEAFPVWHRVRVPQYDSCWQNHRIMAYNLCNDYGDWEEDDDNEECGAGTQRVQGQEVTCEPIQCEGPDGALYSIGDRRRAAEEEACTDRFIALHVYYSCDSTGEWQREEVPVECFDDQECDFSESDAACALIHCEWQGQQYPVWTEIAVPEFDECTTLQGLSVHRVANNLCTTFREWEEYDSYVQCQDGYECRGTGVTNGCVRIQCEAADGSLYDPGTRVAAPQNDQCRVGNKRAVAYDLCTDSGDWVIDDEVIQCGDNQVCQDSAEGSPSCVSL